MHYDIDIDSYIGYPITKGYVRAKLDRLKSQDATVRINSYGGDVMTALDIRQQFIDHGRVTAVICGMTASAATVLAMGAKRILMSRYALMLIHPSIMYTDCFGQFNSEELARAIEELRHTAEDLKQVDAVIASVYANRSGQSTEAIARVMNEARWLTAEEALKLGLVDALLEAEDDEAEANAPAPVTDTLRAHFVACGLPLPPDTDRPRPSLAQRIKDFFSPQAEEPNAPETPTDANEAPQPPTDATEAPTDATETPVEDSPSNPSNIPHTMPTEELSLPLFAQAAGLDALTADAEGTYRFTAEELTAVNDQLAAQAAQIADLEANVEELRLTDGDTSDDVTPEADAQDDRLPGYEASAFMAQFGDLI